VLFLVGNFSWHHPKNGQNDIAQTPVAKNITGTHAASFSTVVSCFSGEGIFQLLYINMLPVKF
jgi:hypothetical protein